MSIEFSGSSPVDEDGEVEVAPGLGLFVDRGEMGLEGPLGDLEVGGDLDVALVSRLSPYSRSLRRQIITP